MYWVLVKPLLKLIGPLLRLAFIISAVGAGAYLLADAGVL